MMADVCSKSELSLFIIKLKRYRPHLTKQQLKTIRGQAINGDIYGAELGLRRILNRNRGKKNG